MGAELVKLLSDADRALGRLDGVASTLPNAELFVAMYVRQEAVLSSQIEGTQSSLDDILRFEAEGNRDDEPLDVEEVYNYVRAMNYGLHRLGTLPLSLRLIRELHEKLLTGVRGGERSPGEFRTSQNWIGPAGCTLQNAAFIPPPPDALNEALGNLETYLHDRTQPALIQAGIAHAQFETIHPFLGGNGRVGRLLITLLLCERTILQQPLLYLSHYFKWHRSEYYDRLMAIRGDGDWEGWLRFFLNGVFHVSQAATETSRDILRLRDEHRERVGKGQSGSNALALLDYLYQSPYVSTKSVSKHLKCSTMTGSKLIERFVDLDILREITGRKRDRLYRYDSYLEMFDRQFLKMERGSD